MGGCQLDLRMAVPMDKITTIDQCSGPVEIVQHMYLFLRACISVSGMKYVKPELVKWQKVAEIVGV